MERREFLTLLGSAAAVGVAPTAAAEYAEQPDSVTITGYANATASLDKYQPMLDLSSLEVDPSRMYAWLITSPEYEYDWHCYWVFYAAQSGVSDEDSHLPDREPVYVGVADGAVEEVVTSDWHYSVNEIVDPTLYQGDHPQLRVIAPWHGMVDTERVGTFVALGDMDDKYADWLTNGWDVNRRAVVDPPTAVDNGHWWRENDQFDQRLAVIWHEYGLGANPFRLDDW